MTTLTIVSSCDTTSCSYNQSGCTAGAITIAGSPEHASCGTFVALDARGGVGADEGRVGACQRLECVHNTALMCTAEAITVSGSTADCASYAVR